MAITSETAEIDPGSISGLCDLQSQLAAAVGNVCLAWANFKFGGSTVPSPEPPPLTVEDDRLARLGDGLNNEIRRLRELADEIRTRS